MNWEDFDEYSRLVYDSLKDDIKESSKRAEDRTIADVELNRIRFLLSYTNSEIDDSCVDVGFAECVLGIDLDQCNPYEICSDDGHRQLLPYRRRTRDGDWVVPTVEVVICIRENFKWDHRELHFVNSNGQGV
ncbi:MAG: hypothetical protein SFX18_10190 [Pirellulales bacterium]|nr:hypothetical protein [Pirellulales bacterium]